MDPKTRSTAVPKAAQVQLSRLFGSTSVEALKQNRTTAEWKRTLRKVLEELKRYIMANVDTDELHLTFIASGILAAEESLREDNFWPGYAEGLTRVAFTLLGDYPDHRQRKGGTKSSDYYGLQLCRSLHYTQSAEQRFRTLWGAGKVFGKKLSRSPEEVLVEFRSRFGNRPTHAHFLRWYKKNFPADYAAVFS